MYYQGFPMGQESATFRDQGAKIHPLSRDKGTTGQAQNLACQGTGRARTAKNWDGTRDKTGRSRKGRSKTG